MYSQDNQNDIDERVVDDEYLKRKHDMAKRIAELRGQRTKLRQELTAYKKYQKTGEKPIDDPKLLAKVMNLSSDLGSETELNVNLSNRSTIVDTDIIKVKTQIQNVSDLIQRYKVENAPELVLNSGLSHLNERKKNLMDSLKSKKAKMIELEDDLKRLTKDSDIKNKQNAIILQISEWQQGKTTNLDDPLYIQQAFQSYITSTEAWREARFNYDRKTIMPNFYLFSWKALMNGINAHYMLISQNDEVESVELQERIDLLYKNKIVVNTTLLDSLKAFVDRINHSVEVSPTPQYPENIFEFMEKNMSSLRAI